LATKKISKKEPEGFDLGKWFAEGLEWWAGGIAQLTKRDELLRRARVLREQARAYRDGVRPIRPVGSFSIYVPWWRDTERARELEEMAEEYERKARAL
jgi:hypothetical protein